MRNRKDIFKTSRKSKPCSPIMGKCPHRCNSKPPHYYDDKENIKRNEEKDQTMTPQTKLTMHRIKNASDGRWMFKYYPNNQHLFMSTTLFRLSDAVNMMRAANIPHLCQVFCWKMTPFLCVQRWIDEACKKIHRLRGFFVTETVIFLHALGVPSKNDVVVCTTYIYSINCC